MCFEEVCDDECMEIENCFLGVNIRRIPGHFHHLRSDSSTHPPTRFHPPPPTCTLTYHTLVTPTLTSFTYTQSHTHFCLFTHTHFCLFTHTHFCLFTHTHFCLFTHTHFCLFTHTHISVYSHTHISVYSHTHISVHSLTHSRSLPLPHIP